MWGTLVQAKLSQPNLKSSIVGKLTLAKVQANIRAEVQAEVWLEVQAKVWAEVRTEVRAKVLAEVQAEVKAITGQKFWMKSKK